MIGGYWLEDLALVHRVRYAKLVLLYPLVTDFRINFPARRGHHGNAAKTSLITLLLPILSGFPQQVDTSLQTVAEQSGFKKTARHGEVVALCQELARCYPNAHYTELGESVEGRPLPLLVLADPPVHSASRPRVWQAGRPGIGNIHAGEVCGKEALPILAREILATPHHPLLKDMVIALAPIYNADGNERCRDRTARGRSGPRKEWASVPMPAALI